MSDDLIQRLRDVLRSVVSWSMCGTQARKLAEDALAAIDAAMKEKP